LLWLSEFGMVPAVGAGLGYLSSVEMQEFEGSRVAVEEKEWEADTYEDSDPAGSICFEIARKADSFSEICKCGRRRDQDDREYPMQ